MRAAPLVSHGGLGVCEAGLSAHTAVYRLRSQCTVPVTTVWSEAEPRQRPSRAPGPRAPPGGHTCLNPLLHMVAALVGVVLRLLPTLGHPLQVPIYFSSAMASRALTYYTLLLNWTNANVRRSVFGAGAGAGARRAAAGVPSVAAAGAEGDAGSPGLEGGEEEEEEEDEEDKEGEEEEEEDDDLGAWGWGAWRAGLSEAAREGRGKAVGLGVGAVSPLPRGIVESSAIRRGGGGASISGRVAANGGGGSATGGVAVQAGAAGSGAPGPGAVPAAPAPASCGVFSEADVYGMFRTLPWDRSLLHVSTACRTCACCVPLAAT